MPLYGHELNEAINRIAAGLGWAVKLDKGDFVGRDALVEFKARPGQIRVGLRARGQADRPPGSEVYHDGEPAGLVTSGTFSPTLQKTLAMALVDPGSRRDRDAPGDRRPRPSRDGPGREAPVLSPTDREARPVDALSDHDLTDSSRNPGLRGTLVPMDPKSLRYTPTHEWVSIDGDVATVGISKFAVDQLTDLIMIDLPAVGKKVTAGKRFGEVESVKAVSDL